MRIKYICFLLISYTLSVLNCDGAETKAQSLEPDQIGATERFEFYSNFWINEHHFLYANADSSKDRDWDSGFSKGELDELSNKERQVLREGIMFYRDSVISYDLLFNRGLSELKSTLINFNEEDTFEMAGFSDDLVMHLNEVKPIYQKYFWEKHRESNTKVVKEHLSFIIKYEDQIFDRISGLAQQPWEDEKVRVDVSYYANWAGAYTSTYPQTHVVITSRDEGKEGDWLELIFHEPSHAIISGRNYKVAELIDNVSKELNLEPPRNLWHSLLFYFSGLAVQEALANEGVDYELYMIRNDVFSRHHKTIFNHMPAYANGEVTFEKALEKLILDYNR